MVSKSKFGHDEVDNLPSREWKKTLNGHVCILGNVALIIPYGV